MSSTIIVDCILPTGIVVPLTCRPDITLSDLKNEIWKEAKKYPLFCVLGAAEECVLVGVTQGAEQEYFWDEARQLSDLRLFSPVLKVMESRSVKEEKLLDNEISLAIGHSVADLDESSDAELQAFRRNIFEVVEAGVEVRHKCHLASLACYHYPPNLELTQKLPASLAKQLDQGNLTVTVWQGNSDTTTEFTSFQVPWDIYPEGLIVEALKRFSRDTEESKSASSQALKICGSNEYLLAARPITQYKTVRSWLSRSKIPKFSVVSRGQLYSSLTPFHLVRPSYAGHAVPPEPASGPQEISLWHTSMDGRLRVNVLEASSLSARDSDQVFVRAGVFHGEEQLCPACESQPTAAHKPAWGEWLQFDLAIQEIPRGAKLCLAVCCERKSTGRKRRRDKQTVQQQERSLLFWGNINLFNFQNQLIHSRVCITLQPPPKGLEELLNPLGLPGPSSSSEAPTLEIGFERRFSQTVMFPDTRQMEDYARYVIKLERTHNTEQSSCSSRTSEEEKKLRSLVQRSGLYELSWEERELVWKHRHLCLTLPDSLPLLLQAINWASRDQVCQLYLLLKQWPMLLPDTALELLQCRYADPNVRRLAVANLERSLSDEALCQYLLQLVQILKREAYLDSPLLRFLLHKALTNLRIGNFIFWQLRSESQVWDGRGLGAVAILEAYCRGLGSEGLRLLLRQVEMMDKLATLADIVKDKYDTKGTHQEKTEYLKDQLKKYQNSLQHLPSPLSPSHSLGRLRLGECRVLDSAQGPLYLAWDNPDHMAPHFSLLHRIIFKQGDDLRQDTLILQIIGTMAQLWQQEDLDLAVVSYPCLTTGHRMGVIEVVQEAKTVYSIQRTSTLAAIQVDRSKLFRWIKEKNEGPRLERAIDNFTRSCAGYCVATFVLGIGDRHPSNIMVTQDGTIFHIDFGHLLGSFKKKLGIYRERVPFVLPQDFLYVIAGGAENPKESPQFQRFQELCEKAYLTLRRHHRHITNLFLLLLATGMPKLQTADDVAYLYKTLAVQATEEEARQFFQTQFCEAYEGAWTTKLDWFFHAINHG